MTKLNFILSLSEKLSALPKDEVEERLHFYTEMIEDRMEEGLREEDAVAAVGDIDEIAAQIVEEIPLGKIAAGKLKNRGKMKWWEITLLAVGSPVWVSLLIAAFAVALSLYVCLWSLVICAWAVEASFVGSSFGGLVSGVALIATGDVSQGLILIAGGLVCAGLAVFAFYGCKAATRGAVWLTKQSARWLKRCFVKKEDAQ